ncbi:PilN domain-containing protein [Pseudomonas guariconensis]|uniref:PilN domain-containing protein n=1 Tax=Pseudomonas guariconensis TaxID=1288410 RepID=UPI0018AA4C60|nr:PilN domain-containing protein [Pseudomonas guariconensis]MBF8741291.1 PilN domain-containing protein [Pseudomonas guariconensis]MBF8750637.1 PilN domain-containing protein [Pseudomonas guariconensis]
MTVRLNLLPWREHRRLVAIRRFKVALVVSLLFALGGVMSLDHLARQRLQQQASAAAAQQAAQQPMEQALARIEALREQRAVIEGQTQALARLRSGQGAFVAMLLALERVMPGGLHLSELQLEGEDLRLLGMAASSAVLAQFMRDLTHAAVVQGLELKRLRNLPGADEFLLVARLSATWS